MTQSQNKIDLRLTVLDIATRWDTLVPHDRRTAFVGRNNRNGRSREGISEDIGQIVEHLASQGVREVRLRTTIGQSALSAGNLDCHAARRGVGSEGLRIGLAWKDGLFGANGAGDGPEVDGVGQAVDDGGVAGGTGQRSQGRQGDESEAGEVHGDLFRGFRGVVFCLVVCLVVFLGS